MCQETELSEGARDVFNSETRRLPLPVELTWEGISYTVKAGSPPRPRKVLHECSGAFRPCEAIGIMGPSGAGVLPFPPWITGRDHAQRQINVTGQPVVIPGQDMILEPLMAWECTYAPKTLSNQT